MNKNKVEDILKKVTPPSEIDQTKKQQLRRELLNSKHFEKKSLWSLLFGNKYILAGVFVLLIAVVIFLTVNENQVTIDNLRQKSNAYYASSVHAASFASFNNDMSIYGSNQSEVRLNVEQVYDPYTKQLYIKVNDEKRIEELDEIIITDAGIYRMENPKIKTVGTVSTSSNRKMHVFVLDDSAQTPAKLELLKKDESIDKFFQHSPEFGYLVYEKPVKTNGEIPKYSSKPFYQEVPKEVDIDKYFRTNPVELADEINSSNTAEYIGDDFDEFSSQNVNLVQLTRDIDGSIVKAYEIVLSKIDSLQNYEITLNHADSITKLKVGGDINWSSIDRDSLTSYKELKTISFASETGEITKVKFAIIKGDVKINLSEIRFTKQSTCPADTSIFNYKKHGLVYAGNMK